MRKTVATPPRKASRYQWHKPLDLGSRSKDLTRKFGRRVGQGDYLHLGVVLLLVAAFGIGTLAFEGCKRKANQETTVKWGESIQEAIDAASPGDVICLSPGEWEENLLIENSLSLRAAEIGSEPQTAIKSSREGWPVIRISNEEPINVTVRGLKLVGAFGVCHRREPDWICACGISLHGRATAVIESNTISNNNADLDGGYGIAMEDSSQATIDNNTISDNGNGISMGSSSQATIAGNLIGDNEGYGVALNERPSFVLGLLLFTGYVTGSGNTGGGNADGDVCPDGLAFLFTEEGGKLDRRE
jgi:parallel beta-helix repeat protein